MDGGDYREGSPEMEQSLGTLGTLYLLKRSTGEKLQGFPIDAERITIGRAEDCDVRIYLPDVSKLHCDIIFDLQTRTATLGVHSANGIHHCTADSPMVKYKGPASIILKDQDTIKLHKKLFRFEYGSIEVPVPPTPAVEPNTNVQHNSPARTPSKDSQPQAVRKRASHRMSLVPAGKTFVPMGSPAKMRRQSMPLGVGLTRTNGPSRMQTEQHVEEADEEEGEAEAVDVVEGDDGETVYLEQKQEEAEIPMPIFNRPFSTPQQTRKLPMRNTSAVPRTRKLLPAPSTPIHTDEDVEMESYGPEAEQVPISTPGKAPKTPRSIPLPPVSDTPYAQQPPEPLATPRLIHSTPRGPLTLRKAILVKSARNVWESTKTPGVEGAIRDGDVEVRRKSLTPTKVALGIALPSPGGTDYDDISDEEEDQDDVDVDAALNEDEHADFIDEEEFVEEFEEVDEAHEDEDMMEDDEEFEEDQEEEEAYFNEEHPQSDLQEEEVEEDAEHEVDLEHVEEDEFEEEELHRLSIEEDHEPMETEDQQLGTPSSTRPVPSRFFTPQPLRQMKNKPRRSLAEIAGPPVRFNRLPATPTGLPVTWSAPAPPGTLGKPSRRLTIAVPEDEEVEDGGDEEMLDGPETPIKFEDREDIIAEVKRRRESLATPRALPLPPSSFKSRIKDNHQTPSHPALLPTSPESPTVQLDSAAPPTPMDALKARLNTMRRQSIHRQLSTPSAPTTKAQDGRRATVGFALPSTPAGRGAVGQSASYTGLGGRKFASTPGPIFPSVKTETPSMGRSFQPDFTPRFTIRNTASLQDILPQRITSETLVETIVDDEDLHSSGEEQEDDEEEEEEEEAEEDVKAPLQSFTPQRATIPQLPLTGMKHLLNPPLPPKTPNLNGLKHLFPSNTNSTPSFQGVRKMFHIPVAPSTPAYGGMEEMFATPEAVEEIEELEEPVQSARLVKRGPKASKAVFIESTSEEEAVEVIENVEPVAPARRVRSAIPKPVKKVVRGRQTPVEDESITLLSQPIIAAPVSKPVRKAVSAPTRSRKPATAEIVTQSQTAKTLTSKLSDDDVIVAVSEAEGSAPTPVAPIVKKTTTRGKSAPSRGSKKEVEEVTKEIIKPATKPRGRPKILQESDAQELAVIVSSTVEEKPKKATKLSSSTSTTASAPAKTVRKPRAIKEVVDKENDDNPVETKVVVKRKTAAVSKKVEDVPVVTTRATRSRKV